jgi:hypothetical protein
MPYTLQSHVTPNGLRVTRHVSKGRITAIEAAEIMKLISKGGPHYGLPLLVISDDSTEVAPEARRIFTTPTDEEPLPSAIVSTSVVMRVTINFIGRVNGNHKMKLFATEAEAVQWLEEVCLPAKPAAGTP